MILFECKKCSSLVPSEKDAKNATCKICGKTQRIPAYSSRTISLRAEAILIPNGIIIWNCFIRPGIIGISRFYQKQLMNWKSYGILKTAVSWLRSAESESLRNKPSKPSNWNGIKLMNCAVKRVINSTILRWRSLIWA